MFHSTSTVPGLPKRRSASRGHNRPRNYIHMTGIVKQSDVSGIGISLTADPATPKGRRRRDLASSGEIIQSARGRHSKVHLAWFIRIRTDQLHILCRFPYRCILGFPIVHSLLCYWGLVKIYVAGSILRDVWGCMRNRCSNNDRFMMNGRGSKR